MFGFSRQERLQKKFRKHGISVVGTVAEIGTTNPYTEAAKEVFGNMENDTLLQAFTANDPPFVVQVSYRSNEGSEELMVMGCKDKPSYSVGDTIPLRYLCENGHYIAMPEEYL